MGFTIAAEESLLQNLRENYREAFRSFADAAEEWMLLQDSEGADLSRIQEAHVRIRDAQRTCRDARDRLACLLLARRRESLTCRFAPEPAQLELLKFVSQLELIIASEGEQGRGMPRHYLTSSGL
ncbi:MAG TPA: hypothetical protein VH601_06995 [Bryobacteraceae bacterium]|jgi:hypothetical protein